MASLILTLRSEERNDYWPETPGFPEVLLKTEEQKAAALSRRSLCRTLCLILEEFDGEGVPVETHWLMSPSLSLLLQDPPLRQPHLPGLESCCPESSISILPPLEISMMSPTGSCEAHYWFSW